jgi:hypothetical protein
LASVRSYYIHQPSPNCMLQGHIKSYTVATRTAEPKRVKTSQNSQRSKARNAVLLTKSLAVRRGMKSFRSLEACNLVTPTVEDYTLHKRFPYSVTIHITYILISLDWVNQ